MVQHPIFYLKIAQCKWGVVTIMVVNIERQPDLLQAVEKNIRPNRFRIYQVSLASNGWCRITNRMQEVPLPSLLHLLFTLVSHWFGVSPANETCHFVGFTQTDSSSNCSFMCCTPNCHLFKILASRQTTIFLNCWMLSEYRNSIKLINYVIKSTINCLSNKKMFPVMLQLTRAVWARQWHADEAW